MQCFWVASGSFVVGSDLVVDGGQQCSRAAGKVRNPQLANLLRIAPIDVFYFGDGEVGEQCRS